MWYLFPPNIHDLSSNVTSIDSEGIIMDNILVPKMNNCWIVYHFSWTIQSCLFIYCPNYLMSLLCFFKGDTLCLEIYVFSSVLFAIRKTLHLRCLIRFWIWLCWLSLQFTLSTYSTILTHLMPLISFYAPWKYHKTRGFLIFSGGIFLMTSF